MAKLYFRYGAMGSSKTAQALMLKYNCEEQGKKVYLIKPDIENRDGKTKIKSRVGLEAECVLFSTFKEQISQRSDVDVIVIDEAQFLTAEDINLLARLVDKRNIDVFCYGLKIDFTGTMFDASKRLFELADKIEEIKTMCWCGQKATMNARIDEHGKIVRNGAQVLMGSNNSYVALCRKHFMSGEVKYVEKTQL
ncbi:thymidine kinase [Lacrimispora amygdalina]|uniref:thymidine kinase n=1 Tax=Lacrimispora amygdalina TaxID=253257 RepID=UPI000BE28183|nr:thymidine kinase [Lacrimispora amygdalina]